MNKAVFIILIFFVIIIPCMVAINATLKGKKYIEDGNKEADNYSRAHGKFLIIHAIAIIIAVFISCVIFVLLL